MNRPVFTARPTRWRQRLTAAAIGLALATGAWTGSALAIDMPWSSSEKAPTGSCFLLFEAGKGEIRREPSQVCKTRITPAATFEIAQALIALDTGAVAGPDEVSGWDGKGDWPVSARRDHTLASALRDSVLWYFQAVARRVGEKEQAAYLNKFDYGNRDSDSGLTGFWLGGSLQITPDEQLAFLRRFYDGKLPVKLSSLSAVQTLLVQPKGVVVTAQGEQPFDAPWPEGASVSAKTGSADDADGRSVRWLVGRVRRDGRVYLFVSCVIGGKDLGANAAVDLAATSLRENGVL
jgi:beta-lactamase class D